MEGILSLDTDVNLNDPRSDVLRILAEVKPEWKERDIEMKTEGGLLNRLFICSSKTDGDLPVIVRVHIKEYEDLFTEKMRVDEKLTMKMLAENRLVRPLYASFQNGYVHEFNPGRTLFRKDFTDEHILRKIAQEQHKVHQLDWEQVHLGRKTEPPTVFHGITNGWKKLLEHPHHMDAIDGIPSFNQVRQDYEYVLDVHNQLEEKYPKVFCHCDSHSRNMIYDEDTGKLTLIDWELSAWGIELNDVYGVTDKDIEMTGDFTSPENRKKYLRIYLSTHPIYAGDEKDERKFMEWYRDLLLMAQVWHMLIVVINLSTATPHHEHLDAIIGMVKYFYGLYQNLEVEIQSLNC